MPSCDSWRVRSALKGIQEIRVNVDHRDHQVYQPCTCGGTRLRNGLPSRYTTHFGWPKVRFSKFTSEEASDPRAYLLSVLHVRMMDSHLLEETMREIYLLVVCGLLLYIVGTYLQSLPKRPLDDKVRGKKPQKCCNNRDQWRKDVEFYVVLSFGEFSVCRLLAANQFLPVTPCRLACKYARMLNNIVVTIYFGFFFSFLSFIDHVSTVSF